MTASNRTIFVLWGQGFDEIAASIFVGELRRMGKRVKLVGLNQQTTVGQNGLILVPDLALGQALSAAQQVHCLLVPAPLTALQQFSHDPRLVELLQRAVDNQALIVVETPPADAHQGQVNQLPPFPTRQILPYPAIEELLTFVQTELAARWHAG